jgi:hypothetical protein
MRSSKVYITGTKNKTPRQISHCSCGTINISANIPLSFSGLSKAPVYQLREDWCGSPCGIVSNTGALFTSTKRMSLKSTPRRLEMSNNTVLITVQDRIADVSESIKFIIKSTEGESGQAGQISCLLNVLSATLKDAWNDLSDYTLENRIGYPDAN